MAGCARAVSESAGRICGVEGGGGSGHGQGVGTRRGECAGREVESESGHAGQVAGSGGCGGDLGGGGGEYAGEGVGERCGAVGGEVRMSVEDVGGEERWGRQWGGNLRFSTIPFFFLFLHTSPSSAVFTGVLFSENFATFVPKN